jgi:hypothetical protein
MAQHPVASEASAPAEIVGTVAEDATRIVFGVLNASPGTAWYDDLELSVEAKDHAWHPLEIPDAGFETFDPMTHWHTGIGIGTSAPARSIDGWNILIDRSMPASGTSSLGLKPSTKVLTEELFDHSPRAGETFDVDLGDGLRARVPIALYSRFGKTIGDDPELARRAQAALSGPAAGFDTTTAAADVIVLWNVLEHFWPYWDTVSTNWSATLDVALAAAAAEHSIDEHVATLERLGAGAPDGHIGLACPGEVERGYPPFAVELVESRIVVTTSTDPAIKRGDVIFTVNNHSATELLAIEETYVSGSPQWQVVGALQRFARGPKDSTLGLRLLRDNHDLNLTVKRIGQRVIENPSHLPIERLDDGIYYVDLSRTAMADIDAVVTQLAAAPGVVFDLRGYPRHNHQVLSYILDHPDDLRGWESIPLIVRPDSASTPAGWEDTSTWNMPRLSVRQPHIGGRVAFLTGPGAISSAESFMALVAYHHLGEIVGSATAGTNGDVAQITLPTGCTTWFTGRRVTKPGGGRHHLIGVQPTIPASRSVAGVRAGRDEVLEKALAYVRTGVKETP